MTFFFDNTFPPVIVDILRLLDVDAVHLREHFRQDTKDINWLPEASRQGWVIEIGRAHV